MQAKTISALFSTGLALLAFGAVYWPEALGSLAASPGLLLIAVALAGAAFNPPRHAPLFRTLKLKRLLWTPVAGSLLSIVVFGWNASFAGKFVTLGLLSLIWLSPLLLIDIVLVRHLRLAAAAGIGICLSGYVLSDLLHAIPAPLLHLVFGSTFGNYSDLRPRGFNEEPSQFSATLARFVFVYYLIWESRRPYSAKRLVGFLTGLALLLVVLGSKGAVTGIALALLSFSVGRRQLPYLVLAGPLAWWLIGTQIDAISTDLERFSSTSTRLTLVLTALSSMATNPLGWGYYGFYGAMQSFGTWSMGWIADRLPVLLAEAEDIIVNLNNVSTKSTTLDFGMVFGWLFFWLLARIVMLVRFDDPRVRSAWVYIMVSSLSTSGHLSITVFLGLAVLLRLYPRRRKAPATRPAAAVPPLEAAPI